MSDCSLKPVDQIDVSVIICTFNRAHNLGECISMLELQEGVESLNWQVIIVDNNSKDNTAGTIKKLIDNSSIRIRYAFEEKQGLSHARNCGISEAESKYLIFIDDDIRVQSEWLKSIYTTFERFNCDAVGGRIHLEDTLVLPKWIRPDMYGFLGYRDFGDEVFKMDGKTQFPFGGNMAFMKSSLINAGGFDTSMGRVGEGRTRKELFKGEETDMFHRLAEEGGALYYHPKATVLHLILPHQLKKSFFRTLHFNAGLQKARHGKLESNKTLVGIPLYLFLQLGTALKKYLIQLVSKGASYSFRQQMNVGYFLGMMVGSYEQRHSGSCSKGVVKNSDS